MVSAGGKGPEVRDQVRTAETSESEPLMKRRKSYNRCLNRGLDNTPGQVWRVPDYWPGGIRRRGGVTAVQARVWNVGTCRPDAKGAVQVETP